MDKQELAKLDALAKRLGGANATVTFDVQSNYFTVRIESTADASVGRPARRLARSYKAADASTNEGHVKQLVEEFMTKR